MATAVRSHVYSSTYCMSSLDRHCLPSAARMAPAILDALLSVKRPTSSHLMISGTPPTAVATTGVPHASDSMSTLGHPSLSLAKQKTSAALYQRYSRSSDTGPTSDTRSVTPS